MARVAIFLTAGLCLATAFAGATEHLPALLLRVIVVVVCVALWPRTAVRVRGRDVGVPLAVLAILVGNLPTAHSLGPALQAVTSATVVIALYLTLLATDDDHTGVALVIFGAVGLVHALWALSAWLAFGRSRGAGGFFNPNDLAAFLAPLALLATAQALSAVPNGWLSRRRGALAAGALALGILATRSRSGLAALVIGGLVLLFWARRRVLVLALAVLLTVVALTPSLRARWAGAGDAFAYDRLAIWQAAGKIALREPAGVGLGGVASALRREGVPLAGMVRYPKVATDAHSELLSAGVELGVTGLILTLGPALFVVWVLLCRWRREGGGGPPSRSPPVGLAVWLAFAIPAAVSASLHVPPVALLAAVWAARVVRADPLLGARKTVAIGGRHRLVLAALLLSALAPALLAAGSRTAMEHAAARRDAGELATALRAARLGAALAPWSLSAGLLAASLELATGASRSEVVEQLTALALLFPTEPEPVERLLRLSEAGPRAMRDAAQAGERVALYAELARRDPKNALAFAALGAAERAADHREAAARAFTAGLEVEPRCASCLAGLAAVQAEAGDREQATALATAAIAADRESDAAVGRSREILSLPPDSRRMLAAYGLVTP
ncbi:MAG: O-antigen ligase family protein [Deltaproteobacteria bacterium]|nr:O-antigen ligase family protein [Deltaproteobacteria bacterium]